MPFDSFEVVLSDGVEAYRALVPTTVLPSLQIVQDAREAVDLKGSSKSTHQFVK